MVHVALPPALTQIAGGRSEGTVVMVALPAPPQQLTCPLISTLQEWLRSRSDTDRGIEVRWNIGLTTAIIPPAIDAAIVNDPAGMIEPST